jgi:uncharacterized integral membrane protein (TIGR00697 family)
MQNICDSKPTYYNHLWFLTLSYTVVIILSNWFDARLIQISFFVTDAGTLVFPLSFLLANIITEVYGLKAARTAIWCGFLFNSLFILYAQLIIHLPSPAFQTQNAAYDTVLSLNFRILMASMTSYLVSEPMNAWVMNAMKIKMHGKHQALRFFLVSLLVSIIDSSLFSILAFYQQMKPLDLIQFVLTMTVIKILIETLFLPLAVYLTGRLKAVNCSSVM